MKRSGGPDIDGLLPGRACRNCIQIKVKCIPLQDSTVSICQRCHRLGKTCSTPAPVARKRRGPSTRVIQLEERVNQLAALLPQQQQSLSEDSSHTSDTIFDQSANRSAASGSIVVATTPADQSPLANDEAQRFEPPTWSSGTHPIARTGSPAIYTPHLADRKTGVELSKNTFCPVFLDSELESQLFNEFRSNMMSMFPFVVIDPKLSAETFKAQRPFSYWACILAATHRDRQLNATLFQEMMKAIGQRIFMAGGKNADHLQGVLLIVAWHHNTFHYNSQLMNLLHLAQALLADMGLLKSIRPQDKIRIASDTTAMTHGTETNMVVIDNEQRRALLGCFCLFSKMSLTFNRIEPMRYSQHIEDCAEVLKNESEYESDLLIVELVRLHRILGRYLQVEPALSSMHRSVFQDELRHYRQGIPASLQNDPSLEMELLSGSFSLLEPSYITDSFDKLDQLNAYQSCTAAINRCCGLLTSIPVHDWPLSSISNTMTLVQVLIVASRISFFSLNGSNAQYTRPDLDIHQLLDSLIQKFESVHESQIAADPKYKYWRFEIYAKKMRHIKIWFTAKIAASEKVNSSAIDQPLQPDFNEVLFENFFDDSLWDDLMPNWADFAVYS